ncbi:unnamed protein product [Onchocerca flexuosa]|uniref:Ribonuclease T n=1 Tax=Onchocerca flexuosa TaxID=387005 RepID=A0A183I706_9BILA|nr:unnamed protein product [Onchocerca flexuosa]
MTRLQAPYDDGYPSRETHNTDPFTDIHIH